MAQNLPSQMQAAQDKRQALAGQLQAGEEAGGEEAQIDEAIAQKTGGLSLSALIQWIMTAPPEAVASAMAPIAAEAGGQAQAGAGGSAEGGADIVSRQAQGAPGESMASISDVSQGQALPPPGMPLPLRSPGQAPAVAAAQPVPSEFERILQAVSESGA